MEQEFSHQTPQVQILSSKAVSSNSYSNISPKGSKVLPSKHHYSRLGATWRYNHVLLMFYSNHVCLSNTGKWMIHRMCSLGAPLINEWALGPGCSPGICIFFLTMHNKVSPFQKLRTIYIYYLTVSISEQSEHKLASSSASGFHKAVTKVSVVLQSHLKFKWERTYFQDHSGCWQTSCSVAVRPSAPDSSRLPAKDSPQLPATWSSAQTSHKPNGAAYSFQASRQPLTPVL